MRIMTHTRPIFACLLLGMAGCTSLRPAGRADAPASVATTFTKVAEHVYSTDWIGFDEQVADVFTSEELSTLARHLPSLQSMIETALGLQDSVWGAKLAGHFRMSKALPLLRYHFLTPRRCYGWEGPDYSKLQSYLADNQYQYSVAYLEAVEAIAGKPIAEAIALTESEAKEIQKHATNENSESYYWALWMQRKLNMKEMPNQRIDHDKQ